MSPLHCILKKVILMELCIITEEIFVQLKSVLLSSKSLVTTLYQGIIISDMMTRRSVILGAYIFHVTYNERRSNVLAGDFSYLPLKESSKSKKFTETKEFGKHRPTSVKLRGYITTLFVLLPRQKVNGPFCLYITKKTCKEQNCHK